MNNNMLKKLYERAIFSASNYEAIAHGEEWIDSCLDLIPVDLPPKDEKYKDFEHFGCLEGKLIMNKNITNLKFADFFQIPFDVSRLNQISEENVNEDLLLRFYQSIGNLPSEILVTKLTFSSNPLHIISYFTKPDDEIFGDIYYKL